MQAIDCQVSSSLSFVIISFFYTIADGDPVQEEPPTVLYLL